MLFTVSLFRLSFLHIYSLIYSFPVFFSETYSTFSTRYKKTYSYFIFYIRFSLWVDFLSFNFSSSALKFQIGNKCIPVQGVLVWRTIIAPALGYCGDDDAFIISLINNCVEPPSRVYRDWHTLHYCGRDQ